MRLNICKFIPLVIGVLFFSNAFAAHWHEHIIRFDSTIEVNQDASITVTEKIKAFANDQLIKQGIIRLLPLSINDSSGFPRALKYKLIKVEMNSKAIPYQTEDKDKKFIISIGDKHKKLKPGYYVFTLQYQVLNAIGFVSKWDELSWNITGYGWGMPILNVEAKVILPKDRGLQHYRANVAPEKKYGVNYTVSHPKLNEIVFKTKYLPPHHALDIGVSWLEGKVTRPTVMEKIKQLIQKVLPMTWQQHALK